MNPQIVDRCQCEKNPYRCEFDDWCICIEVIDAVDLTESPCHKPCLQPDNPCNFVLLVLEREFVADNLTIPWTGNEIPGVVLDVRVEFVSNGFLPLLAARWMVDSFLDCCWFVVVVGIGVPCDL